MYKIQTMNVIPEKGLNFLRQNGCECSPDMAAPEAIILRSAKLHEVPFGEDLLCIGRSGIGVDNIPLPRCTEQGIVVFNAPGGNANAVKELVLCGMLIGSRDINGGLEWVKGLAGSEKVAAQVEKGKSAFVGPELLGKTLGIIGLGAIGSKVADVAEALDMQILGYDPYLSVDGAWRLSRQVQHVTDLDELFRKSDYITMHLHCTDQTRGMINAEAISKMKDGVRVINYARGELVDDDAMLAALESGKVSRYITDFPNDKLAGVKNVIATPHLGGSTPDAEENCAEMAAREILDYLQNGNIHNSVNYPEAVLPRTGAARLCLMHANKPGMLNHFLEIIAQRGINVEHMLNKARGDVAYTIFDTDSAMDEAIVSAMAAIEGVTRVRLLSC